MILVQPRRGGWVIDREKIVRTGALLVLSVALSLAGCSSSQKVPALGEQGPGGESSLKQLQQGKLGGGGQSPLTDIHFEYNDYTIEPQDGSILRSNASWLNAHLGTRVQVEGHCDERGSEEYNLALGARRAHAAQDYLVTLGVSASRISTITYGKELPLCTEHNESCWSQNRRDHFVVSQ